MDYYSLKESLSYPGLLIKLLRANSGIPQGIKEEIISFGPDKQQHIMLVIPNEGKVKKDIIFFVHGGGWQRGSAQLFCFVGRYFASLGYATVLAGYRLAPKHKYPAQLEDTAASFKTGLKALEEKDITINNVLLMGQSAGAHLISLLAYSELAREFGVDKNLLGGAVCISGPINFAACQGRYVNKLIRDFAGSKENIEIIDTYRHLKGEQRVPLLCIHGDKDPLVELECSASFASKVNELSPGKAELIVVKDGLHSNLAALFWGDMKTENAKLLAWLGKRGEG